MRLEVRERDGFRLLNLGPEGWTDEAAQLYATARCDGVGLTPNRAFTDLEFLRPLQGLRSVSVGAAKIKNASALFDKSELEDLGMGLNVPNLQGLSQLTRLRRLALPFRKGIEGIAELAEIEDLQIEEWPKGNELELLGPKPKLRRLWVDMKRSAEMSTSWFSSAPNLVEVNFYSGRLVDTYGLATLTHLERIRFANTKVNDIEFVRYLTRLRSLELHNVGQVSTLAPLQGHPTLTEVLIDGSTQALDGNNLPSTP